MSETAPLLKAVVDTNLFVSGTIFRSGVPNALLRAWRERAFIVVMSAAQRQELRVVLNRPKIRTTYDVTDHELAALFRDLRSFAVSTLLASEFPVGVRDEKDRQIVAAAFCGPADYLITGDNDLLVLAGDPRLGTLQIVTARAFLDVPVAQAQSSSGS